MPKSEAQQDNVPPKTAEIQTVKTDDNVQDKKEKPAETTVPVKPKGDSPTQPPEAETTAMSPTERKDDIPPSPVTLKDNEDVVVIIQNKPNHDNDEEEESSSSEEISSRFTLDCRINVLVMTKPKQWHLLHKQQRQMNLRSLLKLRNT